MPTNNLIINDPVYGFISVPRGLLCRLIEHPLFQRLDRIRQLGMAPIVYPGARHTRKQHSIGALHLMQTAFRTLGEKGCFIFDSEVEATEAAILLHDIGHGPFSHVLESVLTPGVGHEEISLRMMERINRDFHGEISLAIKIFCNKHPKSYLHELISSQLDMDRLDYLCRDSFYTGVREGNIGSARIVKMLDVHDEHLVVDAKGIYSIENYLMARRLMYWQVYLHKTALAAEEMLKGILRRAKMLVGNGVELFATPALHYFLSNVVTPAHFADPYSESLEHYAALDDSDLICAIKVWQDAPDKVLSLLSRGFINRRLFKVEQCHPEQIEERMAEIRLDLQKRLALSDDDAAYFVTTKSVDNEMYSTTTEGIGILMPDGEVKDIASVSNIVRNDAYDPNDFKSYVFRYRLE